MRIRLDEPVDPMFLRAHSRRDGVPEHRGQHRLQAGQIAHHAPVDELVQRGHQTLIQERMDHLPVGCVPTDKEDFGIAIRHVVGGQMPFLESF